MMNHEFKRKDISRSAYQLYCQDFRTETYREVDNMTIAEVVTLVGNEGKIAEAWAEVAKNEDGKTKIKYFAEWKYCVNLLPVVTKLLGKRWNELKESDNHLYNKYRFLSDESRKKIRQIALSEREPSPRNRETNRIKGDVKKSSIVAELQKNLSRMENMMQEILIIHQCK